jgi:hypothetical protein
MWGEPSTTPIVHGMLAGTQGLQGSGWPAQGPRGRPDAGWNDVKLSGLSQRFLQTMYTHPAALTTLIGLLGRIQHEKAPPREGAS